MLGTDNVFPVPVIAALAGRRIDEPDAIVTRFPPSEVKYVAHKLLRRFRQERVDKLVCSAACGADILALEAAEKLAIPATIVLPFVSDIFREVSVTDRPGDWGERFDHLVTAARRRGDLVVLGLDIDNEKAFSKTNDQIIQIASATSAYRHLAFVVWEGKPRGKNDSTAEFLGKALSLGFEKRAVLTMRRRH